MVEQYTILRYNKFTWDNWWNSPQFYQWSVYLPMWDNSSRTLW